MAYWHPGFLWRQRMDMAFVGKSDYYIIAHQKQIEDIDEYN